MVYESLLNRQKTENFVFVIESLLKYQTQLVDVEDVVRNQMFDPIKVKVDLTTKAKDRS